MKETVKEFDLFGTTIRLERDLNKEVDLYNDTLFQVNVFGKTIGITETIRNTWILIGVVFFISLLVSVAVRKYKEIPSGIQNFVEAVVEMFTNFVKSTMGDHNVGFAPFYMGLFVFLLLCNFCGLFALRPPTADLATTFAMGLTAFFMIQGFAIAKQGIVTYVKGFFEPVAVLFPINIIGEFATPISLSFRLFGNILGGTIIMALVYSLPWLLAKIGIPAALHIYFDVFAGALQAFIFTLLSMTFVSNSIPAPEEAN